MIKLHGYDGNEVLGKAIPDRKGGTLQKSFFLLHNQKCKRGHKSKTHRLGNEIFVDDTMMIEFLEITILLVMPYNQRRKLNERAAQTYKKTLQIGTKYS